MGSASKSWIVATATSCYSPTDLTAREGNRKNMKTENMTAAPTAHTPIPWSISADGQRIISADGESVIADVHGAACADQEGAANARMIVRAVNSHAELLAALREIADHSVDGPRDEWAEAVGYSVVKDIARAAIARAESRI